jgi:hypothetical protein
LTLLPFPPSVFVRWAGDLNGIGNPAYADLDRMLGWLAERSPEAAARLSAQFE